jgi:hypothetical protein
LASKRTSFFQTINVIAMKGAAGSAQLAAPNKVLGERLAHSFEA